MSNETKSLDLRLYVDMMYHYISVPEQAQTLIKQGHGAKWLRDEVDLFLSTLRTKLLVDGHAEILRLHSELHARAEVTK